MGIGCFGAAGNRGGNLDGMDHWGNGRTPARDAKWGVNFQKTEEGPDAARATAAVVVAALLLRQGGLLDRMLHVWIRRHREMGRRDEGGVRDGKGGGIRGVLRIGGWTEGRLEVMDTEMEMVWDEKRGLLLVYSSSTTRVLVVCSG